MNKQKLILAVIGGVFGVILLGMGWFVFSAYSAKTVALSGDDEEGIDGLETVVANVEQLSRKAVYPSLANVKAVESNTTAVTEWKEAAFKQASRGDRFFEKTTPAAFKTMVIADARRLAMLPGAVNGHVMKPDFAFGLFHDYIAGGKLPEETELPVLQRQWDDLAGMIETLSKCGVDELTAADLAKATAATPEPEQNAKGKKNVKKPAKKPAKGKAGKDDAAKGPSQYTYQLVFNARPEAFVKVVNAFGASERFTVIEDFAFTRVRDQIALALGGEAKKVQEKPQQNVSRRRRRGAQAEEKKEEKPETAERKSGVVTDPEAEMLAVTLKLTVVDFRSLEEPAEEKNGEEKK